MAVSHPTEFQRALSRLSINAQRAILNTYDTMVTAGLGPDDIVEVLTPLMSSGSLEAKGMADTELARMLQRIEGGDISDYLTGDIAPDNLETIQKSLTTVLEESADLEHLRTRLERLAASHVLDAGQYQMTRSMRRSRAVAGYVRVLESDACELCQWLYRDGYIYPKNRPMTTHPGCVCTARPVTPAELIREADRRYGGPGGAAGGTSDSARRRSAAAQLEWRERAEHAAAGGTPEWGGPDTEHGIRWSAAE